MNFCQEISPYVMVCMALSVWGPGRALSQGATSKGLEILKAAKLWLSLCRELLEQFNPMLIAPCTVGYFRRRAAEFCSSHVLTLAMLIETYLIKV